MNFAHFVPINLQSVHSILCLNDLGNVSWPTYHTPVLPLFLLWKESSCCTIRSLQFPFMILVCPRSLQYHRKIIVLSFISTVWCSVPHPIRIPSHPIQAPRCCIHPYNYMGLFHQQLDHLYHQLYLSVSLRASCLCSSWLEVSSLISGEPSSG